MLNKNSIAFAGQPPYLMERAAGYYEKIASRDWDKGDLLPIGGLFFPGPAVGRGAPAIPHQGGDFGAVA